MAAASTVVVLATYQGARFVEEQLRSVVGQRRPPDHIVVRDDGSTDGTPDLVREVLATSGISYELSVNDRRLGAVGNFAALLAELAAEPRGEIVLLCDQDDRWHERKTATVVAAFGADPAAMAMFSNARLVGEAGEPLDGNVWTRTGFTGSLRRRWDRGDSFGVLLSRNVTPGATLAFRAELLRAALPIPAVGWHDHWMLRVAAAIGRVSIIDEPLVDYRLHSSNVVGLTAPLTLAEKFRRLHGPDPRWPTLVDDAAQLDALAEQLRAAHPAAAGRARQAHLFAQRRIAALSRPRRARAALVAHELASGGYRRYADGLRSALNDVLVSPQGGHAR